ncbi:MAG: hypothetical protein COV08_02005 [Candidatus Vogelbacteria bacterium CG10_big_fil_rev_8_21_14_0_10_49_38]|uniref:Uncharacterized protein n=1 Tax=Candidatus Vogelbacteria bacterium CG10_big_fil_rev_8_21_14_0_10_49_38 TaxID=1975043 RepID=A0A2H0RHT9_9BACT|nr:MAG: hypothetical protein BK006_02025 [bacterium CG10_49_38]PIR46027.1 MAG: hypothetical protein COV08_02005 [Candidatus Vogelbacteria bacterium CG10_big_fil_rev_8_21_14_0_10_49_38]
MVLTSHAVFGAALAVAGRLHPVGAFVAGFGSHFLLDALPHWEYELRSFRRDRVNPLNNDLVLDRAFLNDLAKIGLDAGLGLALVWFFFVFGAGSSPGSVLAGALGGILPDGLSFVYMKTRSRSILVLQKFHILIHTEKIITNPVAGLPWQALLLVGTLLFGGWSFFGY